MEKLREERAAELERKGSTNIFCGKGFANTARLRTSSCQAPIVRGFSRRTLRIAELIRLAVLSAVLVNSASAIALNSAASVQRPSGSDLVVTVAEPTC